MNDEWHMRAALGLARRGLGAVWPNPAVGCVIARDDAPGERVVGRGVTAPGGRPHAETEALKQAGEAAKGATAYVTLEPCAHHGQTPPCADALVKAGVRRVVVAMPDPDERVNGEGIARLKAAGIQVDVGLLAEEARRINAGFIMKATRGRPLFTLKVASTLDGRIATTEGKSQWITGDLARRRGHLLRAQYDAILVGAGTVQADNPSLTCRLGGLEGRSPVRIVLDSQGRLGPDFQIFTDASLPTWHVVGKGQAAAASAKQIEVPLNDGRIDVEALAARLGEEGLTRVLIEGGSQVAASFLKAKLIGRLVWFRAPSLMGGDGLAAIGDLGVQALESMPRLKRTSTLVLGEDVMDCFDLILDPAA